MGRWRLRKRHLSARSTTCTREHLNHRRLDYREHVGRDARPHRDADRNGAGPRGDLHLQRRGARRVDQRRLRRVGKATGADGVRGEATNARGVMGWSTNSIGVYGLTSAANPPRRASRDRPRRARTASTAPTAPTGLASMVSTPASVMASTRRTPAPGQRRGSTRLRRRPTACVIVSSGAEQLCLAARHECRRGRHRHLGYGGAGGTALYGYTTGGGSAIFGLNNDGYAVIGSSATGEGVRGYATTGKGSTPGRTAPATACTRSPARASARRSRARNRHELRALGHQYRRRHGGALRHDGRYLSTRSGHRTTRLEGGTVDPRAGIPRRTTRSWGWRTAKPRSSIGHRRRRRVR